MSVLIKGMEMPKSCYDCEIRIKCGCKVANDSGWLNNKIDDHCPFAFVEVPKHGRLIDADEAIGEIVNGEYIAMVDKYGNNWMMPGKAIEIIANAPTIIEAEE